MADAKKSRAQKSGLPPGTPVHIGERMVEEVTIKVHQFTEHQLEQFVVSGPLDSLNLKKDQMTTWINVQGLQQVETLQTLANVFGWHPLVVEDLVNTCQRPKLEDYGDYLFIVLKRLRFTKQSQTIQVEQVSIIQGPKYVVTLQESADDAFGHVLDRLQNDMGRIRSSGTDYLAYEIVDAIVDQYFGVLEQVDQHIEDLEDEVLENPSPESLQKLQRIKRDTITIRSSVWPLREVMHHLQHSESSLVTKATSFYFRDVYDHTVIVIETIEISRDILAGVMDIYLTSLSNRMNETMKILSTIATIFLPLTFITGIFGMNFQRMGVLQWEWGFPVLLILMLVLTGGMLVYFRRKMWL
jgi:magnesium transporter